MKTDTVATVKHPDCWPSGEQCEIRASAASTEPREGTCEGCSVTGLVTLTEELSFYQLTGVDGNDEGEFSYGEDKVAEWERHYLKWLCGTCMTEVP